MKIIELQGKLVVGDIVETNADGTEILSSFIKYKVTRILKTKFFVTPIDSNGEVVNTNDEWYVTFTNPTAEIKVLNRTVGNNTKTKVEEIDFKIERDGRTAKIFIKIPEKMEEYFKGLSNGVVKTSKTWFSQKEGEKPKGVDFYALTDEYKALEEKINNYRVFNSFGDGLINDEKKINLAPLRIVGASEGVEIFSDNFTSLDNLGLKYFITKLAEASKEIWSNCISKKIIKGKIRFEIEI
jgi:hypothetical protein